VVFLSEAVIDGLLAFGGMIGTGTKLYALIDSDTKWSRRSSGLNALLYPVTSLAPFLALGLYLTALTSTANWLIWVGIYIWRAPENEDLIGRKGKGDSVLFGD